MDLETECLNAIEILKKENKRLRERLEDKDQLLSKQLKVNEHLSRRIKELEDDTE